MNFIFLIVIHFLLALARFDDPEVQRELGQSDLGKKDVPGRIAQERFYPFWRDVLRAPEDILESLRDGYKIPLKAYPPRSRLPHNQSARDPANFEFLDKDISLLEQIGAIV